MFKTFSLFPFPFIQRFLFLSLLSKIFSGLLSKPAQDPPRRSALASCDFSFRNRALFSVFCIYELFSFGVYWFVHTNVLVCFRLLLGLCLALFAWLF
jgi:hypothetical protein